MSQIGPRVEEVGTDSHSRSTWTTSSVDSMRRSVHISMDITSTKRDSRSTSAAMEMETRATPDFSTLTICSKMKMMMMVTSSPLEAVLLVVMIWISLEMTERICSDMQVIIIVIIMTGPITTTMPNTPTTETYITICIIICVTCTRTCMATLVTCICIPLAFTVQVTASPSSLQFSLQYLHCTFLAIFK